MQGFGRMPVSVVSIPVFIVSIAMSISIGMSIESIGMSISIALSSIEIFIGIAGATPLGQRLVKLRRARKFFIGIARGTPSGHRRGKSRISNETWQWAHRRMNQVSIESRCRYRRAGVGQCWQWG